MCILSRFMTEEEKGDLRRKMHFSQQIISDCRHFFLHQIIYLSESGKKRKKNADQINNKRSLRYTDVLSTIQLMSPLTFNKFYILGERKKKITRKR